MAILGDLHMDPRDVEHSYEGRGHVKAILDESPNPFLVSLGDLGESKDCTESKQLFAGRGLHSLTSELNLRTFGTHRSSQSSSGAPSGHIHGLIRVLWWTK